jgi:predicted RNase H-like nuclease (RuvC/YqgF family)
MKISRDELLELLDDICSEVSRVVASHAEICRELAEDSLDRTRTDAQQTRIDRLKMELEREKAALNTLRRRQQHKRKRAFLTGRQCAPVPVLWPDAIRRQ